MKPLFDGSVNISEEAVIAALENYNIPFHDWGTGNSKTLAEFVNEIRERELIPYILDDQLIVASERILVHLSYLDPDGTAWEIIDAVQVYADGRERDRGNKGMREKMHEKEPREAALLRAIHEESGHRLAPALERFKFMETHEFKTPKLYAAYPGLLEVRTVHEYSLSLTAEEMEKSVLLPQPLFAKGSRGFIEVQEGVKTCYCQWQLAK